jgi:hypothetical protein
MGGFIGLYVRQGIVALHGVTYLFIPLDDFAFRHGIAQEGHSDHFGHIAGSVLSI